MANKAKKKKAVKAVAKAVRKAILKGVSGEVVEQAVELTIVKIAKAKDPEKRHSKKLKKVRTETNSPKSEP